jgi:hypothetical protein
MPPELRELLEQLASEGVEVRSQQDLERALAERPDLRERLAAAVGTTRRDLGDVPPELAPILEELSKPVRRTDMPRRVQLCREARAIASN